jgi:hypothetical protein
MVRRLGSKQRPSPAASPRALPRLRRHRHPARMAAGTPLQILRRHRSPERHRPGLSEHSLPRLLRNGMGRLPPRPRRMRVRGRSKAPVPGGGYARTLAVLELRLPFGQAPLPQNIALRSIAYPTRGCRSGGAKSKAFGLLLLRSYGASQFKDLRSSSTPVFQTVVNRT